MPLLLDLTPLRVNPAYRRLYAGFTFANVGSQLATVAIGLQVYDLTRSTAAVGLVGLFALVPLVVMGLYGGALIDHFDRRTVGLVGQSVAFATMKPVQRTANVSGTNGSAKESSVSKSTAASMRLNDGVRPTSGGTWSSCPPRKSK